MIEALFVLRTFFMRKLVPIFSSLLIALNCFSQSSFKKNAFYFEIAGNGPVLSVNYERQLGTKPGFGCHLGIGLGDSYPSIPMGFIYLYNLGNNKSFLEAGLGVTLAEESLWQINEPNKDSYPYAPGFIPSIGYRYQALHGLIIKAIYSPIFTKYRNLPLFFGISAGWRI